MLDSILNHIDQARAKNVNRVLGIFMWVILLSIAGFILFLPFSTGEKIQLSVLLIITLPYSLTLHFALIPDIHTKPFLYHATLALGTLLIGWLHYILGPYHVQIEIYYPLMIMIVSIFGGWESALLVAAISIGVNYSVNASLVDFRGTQYAIIQIFSSIGLAVIGFISGFIGRTLRDALRNAIRKNRVLSMLVEANHILATKDDLEHIFPTLARIIAQGLPATLCRILLLDKGHDSLIDFGNYPLRPGRDHETVPGQAYALDKLPLHARAIEENRNLIVQVGDPQQPLSQEEMDLLYFNHLQSICVIPIQESGNVKGLISIGEQRSPDREPFTPQRVELLSSLATQMAHTLHTTRLRQALQVQADRLSVLYDVSKAISRTIEIDDLLELIHQQLTRVLPSDAYFVALYLPEEEVLDLRILIDDGKRYPPQKIPADQGLSGWIVSNHQPLLIKNLEEESDQLPIDPVVVGQDKVTPSWLGVPLISEGELLGILAVASYQTNAFQESDQYLLEQIAQQAALSIKNARHHRDVERQARLDSLTQVYNHGHFIHILHQEARKALQEGHPLSLIMLDIDYFKQYNDTYGHVVGDEVLKLTVESIQKHIKSTDAVGRWGGEEFGIALPNATLDQAEKVAHRIRHTLANLPLQDTEGNPIPKPTISQGIATLPDHSREIDELIIIADRALYQAKSRGRDQFMIAEPDPH